MKLWKLMLAMALVLVVVFALASCGSCDHTYDCTITKEATCTEAGVATYTCSICGDSYNEAVEGGDHDYKDVGVKPTCTTAGVVTHTCKACGYSYTEELDPAKGHTYVETVIPATCVEAGSVSRTCSACGDVAEAEVLPATGVHALQTTVVALTDEQKATNPKAIGVEAVACSKCDYKEVTTNAVYVYMDFDTVPTVTGYEGSASYQLFSDSFKQEDANGAGLVYIDMQANVRATRPGKPGSESGGNAGSGFFLNGDGRLSLGAADGYIADELYLVSKTQSALEKFTISFDIIHGKKPTKDLESTKNDRFFFLSHPNKYTQFRSLVLVLNKDSVNADGAYELMVQRYDSKATPEDPGYNLATGFFMSLDKEYTFKIEIDYSVSSAATIYVKETGSSEAFQNIGTYDQNAGFKDWVHGYFYFNGTGNSIDNFKVTAPLGAERLAG